MTEVQAQMTDLIALIAHPEEVLERSNDQHAKLVKALRKGDGPRAVKAMREHIEGTEHILAGLLPPQARMRLPSGSKSGSERDHAADPAAEDLDLDRGTCLR